MYAYVCSVDTRTPKPAWPRSVLQVCRICNNVAYFSLRILLLILIPTCPVEMRKGPAPQPITPKRETAKGIQNTLQGSIYVLDVLARMLVLRREWLYDEVDGFMQPP